MPKIQVKRTVVWTYEVDYTPETYGNMSLDEAANYEQNLGREDVLDALIETIEYSDKMELELAVEVTVKD